MRRAIALGARPTMKRARTSWQRTSRLDRPARARYATGYPEKRGKRKTWESVERGLDARMGKTQYTAMATDSWRVLVAAASQSGLKCSHTTGIRDMGVERRPVRKSRKHGLKVADQFGQPAVAQKPQKRGQILFVEISRE